MTPRTICAISTPPGVGGIAVARISGPQAIAIADSVWQGKSPLAGVKANSAHVGFVLDTHGEQLDQAVVTVFRAPHSFTGEDVVEISVHGSVWVQRELLASLIAAGASMAEAGEFTRRAFLNGRLDLTQAEAVADLIASTSRASQRQALNHMRGAFSQRIEAMREQLVELAALLELELDFSEEDVEFASRERLIALADDVAATTRRLADSFAAGQAIRDGIPVAIVGATNAGKSSILNALADDDRAIVSDVHGTTRDIVEDRINVGDYTLRLMDTAGIRQTADAIESLGIERSRRALQTAYIILLVVDSSDESSPTPWAEVREAMAGNHDARLIIVLNKSDLTDIVPEIQLDAPTVATSARTGQGIDALRSLIAECIASGTPTGADAVVANARHHAALLEASAAASRTAAALRAAIPADLAAQDLRVCIDALASITGRISTPEILSTIFSRFCVGK